MAVSINNPNFGKALEKLVDDFVDQKLQPGLDELFDEMQDQPVTEIKPVLQKKWEAMSGGEALNEPALTKYATAISEGRRIVLERDLPARDS